MGRKILVQRRGRGTQNFRSPKHKKIGKVKHPKVDLDAEELVEGELVDFLHEGGRGTPIGLLKFGKGDFRLWLPPEGVFIGEKFAFGKKTEISVGNTMQLKNVPEGMLVYNIEGAPGDGGKIARSPGAFAIVVERTKKGVNVRLPSGKRKLIHPKSLATLGVVSGGGVASKPFMKAGHKYYYMKTKASNWPRVTCATMNATSHPHGGGAKRTPGRSTTVGRHAPPGRKVGMIAARQSGRKRSKKNK